MQALIGVAKRPLIVAASLLVILLAVAFGLVAFYELRYINRAYPGVKLQGREIGGLTAEQIFGLAETRRNAYFNTATINLQVQDKIVPLRPADLGAGIDPAATTLRALQIGRSGNVMERLIEQFRVGRDGTEVDPVIVMDDSNARRLIGHMTREVERAPVDAKVQVMAGGAREVPSIPGATLDAEALTALAKTVAMKGEPATVALPLKPVQPKIPSASLAASEAAQIVGSDVVILVPQWNDDGTRAGATEAFRITSATLPEFVSVEQTKTATGETQWQIRVRKERFRSLIEPLAKAVNTPVLNARLDYDADAHRVRALSQSKIGNSLDVNATLDAIEQALRSDKRDVLVVTRATQPDVRASATASELGITGLITQATTFFKGSSAARMKNVEVAASRFQGVVIPPGGTFSFNEHLGEVSKEEGFEEGLIIVGDRTIPGVGGGVCQVSTTAFQAALRAGFPILERYPHAYRVSYYERGMGPGFDAAVFTPIVDMKFKNDTQGHLLIETSFDAKNATLTFKFYGRPDGREVSFTQPVIGNPVKHGPDIYEKDPEGKVAAGKAKQVDYAVDGATINVSRIVKNGGPARRDNFASRYVPWQARFYFGVGFVPPPGAEVKP